MKRLPPQPAPELTADEQRCLAAFREMDARGKQEYLVRMEATAVRWPECDASKSPLAQGGAA